jgi:hypothetical protein
MAQTPDARFAHFQLHFWLSFERPVWHILGPKPTGEIRPGKKTSPLRHLQRWRHQPQFPHHPSPEPKNGHEDPRSHERRGGHAEQSSWRKGTANTGASSCSGIYSDSNVSEILTAGPKTTTEANCSRHQLSHLIESFLVVQTRRRDCTYDPRFV